MICKNILENCERNSQIYKNNKNSVKTTYYTNTLFVEFHTITYSNDAIPQISQDNTWDVSELKKLFYNVMAVVSQYQRTSLNEKMISFNIIDFYLRKEIKRRAPPKIN